MDDPIYPLLGKPRPLGRPTIDSQVEKITVRHLLLHAGGWDTKYHSDVLRQTRKISRAAAEKLPLSADAVLRYGLSQPLDFAPGTRDPLLELRLLPGQNGRPAVCPPAL